MKDEPLVSIIMAEYNTDPKLLMASIQSIINQTYNNWELIIIDDCGKNDVQQLVEPLHNERIKVIKNQRNMGLPYSLNLAIENACGEYIARMDTDDYSYPNRIKREVIFLQENPDYDIIGANRDYYDGKKIWGQSREKGEVTKKKILKGSPLSHPTVMYKASVIKSIGGYRNYYRCEDYATWIELFIKEFKMFVLDNVLIRYRLSQNDYNKRTLKFRKEYISLILNEYIKLKPSKHQLLNMILKNCIAGLIPKKIMYKYHETKYRNNDIHVYCSPVPKQRIITKKEPHIIKKINPTQPPAPQSMHMQDPNKQANKKRIRRLTTKLKG